MKKTKKTEDFADRLVYSTDTGRACPGCRRPLADCICRENKKALVQGDGKVRVRRETGGRGGKTVTTITGLPLNETQLQELLRDLKRRCGTGGTLKDGVLEIQGDHCDALVADLITLGYQAKRAGG